MGRFSNLGLIFYRPSAVARSVNEKPDWVIPVILVLILGFVAVYASYQYNVEYQKQVFEKVQRDRGTGLDPESYFKVTPAKRVYGGVIGGLGMVLGVLVGAAILHGLALVVGGKSGFRKMFCLYAYAWIIPAVGGLVKLPLVIAKQSIDVRSSLALLTPGVAFDSPLGVMLNSVDLFYVWMLAATVIGYNILTGLGMKKSVAIVVGLYILFVAFSVSATLLRSRVMG
jgi:hypothetical protein